METAQAALTESPDVFRHLASATPIGILLLDTEGRVKFANERWRANVGVAADEPVEGFDWVDFIHPDDRAGVLVAAREAADGDGAFDREFRFVARDGAVRWTRCQSAVVRDAGGEVRGWVVTSEDVTDERAANDAQRRLTQALETTPDFVIIVEVGGRVIYANAAIREQVSLHGDLDAGELVSSASFTPESWDTIAQEAWPALREKGEWQGELTVVRPDGCEVPIIQSARAHRNSDGYIEYISAIARDISETRRFENQLAESEARFRALVERSHDLVALFDANGTFAYASPSHARVLGYQPSDLLGQPALELIHPDDRQKVADAFAAQILGVAPITPVEQRQRHRDGSYRWIESVAHNRLQDPSVQGIVVNARDITERKRAEQLAADEARILEHVARGAPLRETLAAVVAMVESVVDDCVGAVVAPVRREGALEVLSGPRLDASSIRALEAEPAAAPPPIPDEVFVRDLEDAREATSESRRALMAAGFRTAWIAPLRSGATGEALGGLLVLRRDRRRPSPADHRLLALAGNVASIAIVHDREVKRLARAARRDPLTGLSNRLEALERLATISDAEPPAVLFLDLDRFKLLNDSHGHVAGDRVLVEIGRRLRAATRPGDLVARLGGDEFVVICEQLAVPDDAVDIANRLLGVVREPVGIGDHEVVVTTSIGIATGWVGDPEAVLRDADTAMYLAKERGRDRAEVFDPARPRAAGG